MTRSDGRQTNCRPCGLGGAWRSRFPPPPPTGARSSASPPSQVAADAQAQQEGWTHADTGRGFHLELWEYDADRVDGFEYDIGAVLLRSTRAADESLLLATLQQWQLHPRQFLYAWDSGDPR